MRKRYSLVALILISFSLSFCTQEDKTKEIVAATASENIEKGKIGGKCCASNIPARFPVKNKNIPHPGK
jgi:hypothetical protein